MTHAEEIDELQKRITELETDRERLRTMLLYYMNEVPQIIAKWQSDRQKMGLGLIQYAASGRASAE